MAAMENYGSLGGKVGQELGVSQWLEITQDQVRQFADAVVDHQFIHVDPDRARAKTSFGGTIAHGFLTLSLLTRASHDILPLLPSRAVAINYGFDKVRFLTPVPVGARIRVRFVLVEFTERGAGEFLAKFDVTVEIENRDRPALVAQWLTLTILQH